MQIIETRRAKGCINFGGDVYAALLQDTGNIKRGAKLNINFSPLLLI